MSSSAYVFYRQDNKEIGVLVWHGAFTVESALRNGRFANADELRQWIKRGQCAGGYDELEDMHPRVKMPKWVSEEWVAPETCEQFLYPAVSLEEADKVWDAEVFIDVTDW